MNVFDILNSITHTKKLIFLENDPEMEKEYIPFLINRGLSYYADTIMHANEMNSKTFASKRMQHDYYHNSIKPRKRYSKWLKKTSDDDIEFIQKYYNISKKRAIEALEILTKADVDIMREEASEGGV